MYRFGDWDKQLIIKDEQAAINSIYRLCSFFLNKILLANHTATIPKCSSNKILKTRANLFLC